MTTPFFQEPLFWKSAIKGGALQNENRCLIALLKADKKKFNEIRATCTGDKVARIELSKNIFVITHQFGAIQGSLLVVNKPSIFEVSCLSSMLIDNCLGFCIIAISDECQIIVNSELIRESNKIASTFSPKIIINRNTSLAILEEIKAAVNDDQIQFILIGMIVLCSLCIIITQVSCFCCNRLKASQEYVSVSYAKEKQPDEHEILKNDEQLSCIAKM